MLFDKSREIRISFDTVRCVVAVLALYAIGNHDYAIYVIIRWLIFLTCCWGLWINRGQLWPSAAPLYAVVAILFNPFYPLPFAKATWRVMDVIAALALAGAVAYDVFWKDASTRERA